MQNGKLIIALFAHILSLSIPNSPIVPDLLIAIGGGSVIVAARAVNIFLCESKNPFELMTQYPTDKPAYSPRLLKPKWFIIA